MLTLKPTSKFKKDLKKIKKRGLDMARLDTVLNMLLKQETLPQVYYDHALKGNYQGFRECHIQPDWLLIYMIEEDNLVLVASRTGTHSELF